MYKQIAREARGSNLPYAEHDAKNPSLPILAIDVGDNMKWLLGRVSEEIKSKEGDSFENEREGCGKGRGIRAATAAAAARFSSSSNYSSTRQFCSY